MLERAQPYSMTSPERLVACMDATRYVVHRGLPGALVECGVWKGGSVLAMVLTLQRLGVEDRDVYMFDTFEGMTTPTGVDTSRFAEPAVATWERARQAGTRAWHEYFGSKNFGLNQVREIVSGTGYPPERLHFVVGRVEETIPDRAPDRIALLRLDTDWYESTRHELEHLYPRLVEGGPLIVDDYGHWDGCRRAVDEYFAGSAEPLLLARIDYTGRIAIKH